MATPAAFAIPPAVTAPSRRACWLTDGARRTGTGFG